MATVCILQVHPREEQTETQQTNTQTVILDDLTDIPHANLSPEEALRLEIERLCTATLTIEKAFNDIGVKLSNISKEKTGLADLHNTCCTLKDQWAEHHRTYIKLLWRSREFAGKAQAVVDDFRKMVLPSLRDRSKTPEEKQQLIREQMESMEKTAQPSEQICQEFNDFSDALDKYIEEFSRIVEGLKIDEQTKKVGKLKNELKSVKSAMGSVSQEVKNLGWQLAKGVAVVGIAALLAFATPSLFARLAIAGVMVVALSTDYLQIKDSGVKLYDAWKRYKMAVADYNSVKAEHDSEIACLDQMVNLESTLQDARPLVQEVTMKLGIFATVWAAITADIRKLKNWLCLADNPSSQLFVIRVQNLETMYGYLSQALHRYQVTVRLPAHGRHRQS